MTFIDMIFILMIYILYLFSNIFYLIQNFNNLDVQNLTYL